MNRIKLRENTFKLLYCNEFHNGEEMPRQCDLFLENIESMSEEANEYITNISEEDKEYITNRVSAITEKKEEIDKAIDTAAVKWTTNRMSKVDLTILRLAYYEMKLDDDVPEKVAIDQAVELAKKYGGDDSAGFVNGILAKLF